jgi:hypothetical protein
VEIEGRIVAENRQLELPQLFARLQAELVVEYPAQVAVSGKRVGLATRPVEGEHLEPAEVFAVRVLADERFELGDRSGVLPEREPGLEARLERSEAKLFEPADLVARKLLVPELGERRPSPEAECLVQLLCCATGVTAGEEIGSAGEQSLESFRVQIVGLEPQQIAGGARLEGSVAQ